MGLHDEARLDQKFIGLARQMNLYLNHFPKHEKFGLALEIRHTAYDVYGYIVEAQKRYQKKTTLARVTRGVNFVGYRTWASRRFVRKHALYVFRQSIKSGQVESLVSSLGHALRTHSLRHMLRTLKEKDHALYRQLPEVFRRVHLA